jgi:hypothetical protein
VCTYNVNSFAPIQVVTHGNTITIDVHGKAHVTVAPKSESSS